MTPQKKLLSTLILVTFAIFFLLNILSGRAQKSTLQLNPAILDYLKFATKKAHPTGSDYHLKVLQKLQESLQRLGCSPELQEKDSFTQSGPNNFIGAKIRNVICRLNSSSPEAKTVLFMAHYDSANQSKGANDDGSGIAALMHSISKLKDQPRENNLVFLFSDAEELALLGAESYFLSNPKPDYVVNFEARGSSGSSALFERGGFSDRLHKDILEKSQLRSMTQSFFNFLFEKLPNDTDYSVFKSKKIPGLNFAYGNGIQHYHHMTDNMENLSWDSLSHHAENAEKLGLTLKDWNFNKSYAEEKLSYFSIFDWKTLYFSSKFSFLCLFLSFLLFPVLILKKCRSLFITLIPRIFLTSFKIALFGAFFHLSFLLLLKIFGTHSYAHNAHYLFGCIFLFFIVKFFKSQKNTRHRDLTSLILLNIFACVLYFKAPNSAYPLCISALSLCCYHLFNKVWLRLCFILPFLFFFASISYSLIITVDSYFPTIPALFLFLAFLCIERDFSSFFQNKKLRKGISLTALLGVALLLFLSKNNQNKILFSKFNILSEKGMSYRLIEINDPLIKKIKRNKQSKFLLTPDTFHIVTHFFKAVFNENKAAEKANSKPVLEDIEARLIQKQNSVTLEIKDPNSLPCVVIKNSQPQHRIKVSHLTYNDIVPSLKADKMNSLLPNFSVKYCQYPGLSNETIKFQLDPQNEKVELEIYKYRYLTETEFDQLMKPYALSEKVHPSNWTGRHYTRTQVSLKP